MTLTEKHLIRIQEKLQVLLKKHDGLQKENSRLKDELEKTKQNTALLQKTSNILKQQVNVLKLGGGEMNEADKKAFEKQINVYLKEIDKCIALLSK